MPTILFTNLEISFDGRTANVNGKFENDGFSKSEIQKITDSILTSITDIKNDDTVFSIQGNVISGFQSKI